MNDTTSTNRKLRIASVYSNMIIGGDQNRLLEYLSSRNQNKYEHFVIVGLSPSKEHEKLYGPIFDRFKSVGVEVIELGVATRYTQWQSASRLNRFFDQVRTFNQLVKKTTEVLKENKIDIVEGRCDMGTILATLAGRRAGVNAVISTNYFPQLERFRSPLWSMFGKYLHTKIDAVICDSVACLNDMRDWMIFPPPGYCIPNGIRSPQATIAKEKITAQLGIPTDAKVIAQIARVQPYKGQDLLLEAAPEILAKHPNAFFLICGYTGSKRSAQEYLARLNSIAENTGIRDRVCITSYPGNIGDIWPVSRQRTWNQIELKI